MRPATIDIDLNALQHNFHRVRTFAPQSKIMAMVKADAYGHGIERVAESLQEADAFGVACIEEARMIRQVGLKNRIVLMAGFFAASELPEIAALNCDIVLHDFSQLDSLEKCSTKNKIQAWLKIDTGMHRLGFSPENFSVVYERLLNCQSIKHPIFFISHFADADLPEKQTTQQQIDSFHQLVQNLPGEKSLSGSAGIIDYPDAQLDWVRPGIMLYGGVTFPDKTGLDYNLKPVMTMRSKIMAIRQAKKGDAIGYGGIWQCPEDMPVGVIAIGYGDGYPRHAISGTPILVNGHICPLIGRVSMDMISVDLRPYTHAKVGDPVILWGKGLPVETIAQHAGTIADELLCVTARRLHGIEAKS